MGYHFTALLLATAAAMAVALEPSAVENKDSSIAARGKRTLEFFPPVPRSYGAAERRISTGPTATSRVAISTHYFDRGTPPITIRHQTRVPTHHANGSNRRTRPHSVPAPPYAVQMEPLVQYSQRDPLYHQQKQASSGKTSDQSSFNDLQQVKKSSAPVLSLEHPPKSQHVSSSELSLAALPTSIEQETSRTDHDLTNQIPRDELLPFHDSEPSAGQFASQHLYPYEDSPYYLREPEPIIEIIVKESNVTLPPAPTPPTPPSRPPTKEPVQVFYVKYKKESSKYGKEGGIIYDPPIPAVTPASNSETEAHYPASSEVSTHPPTPPPPPPPTTTLRTIIRPDSETFHGSGLHVTFGDPNDEESHEDYQQQSAPHPSVIFPQQNFNLRKSVGPSQRPSFLPPHEHHKRQPEPFQQQPPVSLHQPQHHPFNQQHQQNQFPPHQPPFQRPFNPPPFHQQRQPPFQQPPHLSQPPPTFNQPPAPFRHLPPPPPQHPPSQKPNFHQSFQQPPFPFQPPRQQPPPQSPSQNNQRPPHIQIQQSQQVPLPSLRPNFQESLQRPPFQPQNLQHRPHFPSPSPTPEQRKPGFPPQQPPVFPTPAEQQRINAPPHPNIHQTIQPQQHQQQSQQQQQQLIQQQQQQQFQHQQLQSQQQQHQQQQQRLQFQQQQFQHQQQQPQQQKHQPFTQQSPSSFNQQHPIPPQLFSQGNKDQNPFSGEIVKSISQQLHLTPTEQSTLQQQQQQQQQQHQQQFPNSNNHQPSLSQQQQQLLQQQLQQQQFQQQQLQQQLQQQQQQSHFPHQQVPNSISTPTPLFQQSTINQQFSQSQSIPTHQQFQQQRPEIPQTNNFTTPHKLFSYTPTTTQAPTTVTTSKLPEAKTEASSSPEDEKKTQTALAALPDEVPEDLRQQLLSSGILSNADIQILDYDKVGDIPIENLPPHALENFYGAAGSVGAASAPVPQVVALNDSKTPVEMKVVRFDPATAEGQEVAEKYVRNDATQVDPVVLNDSKYNRYLPLKVNGAQFPVPDVPELRGRNVTSVVVLAPVDYDFRKPNHTADDSDREGRSTRVEVQGVQFVAGDVLKELVKEPTVENYKKWLAKKNSTEADRQSIVLLVVGANDGNSKDIYMYDVGTQKVSRLRGELSSAFVEVAEANANSQELGSVAAASENWQESPFDLEPSAAASEIQEQIVLPAGVEVKDLSSSLSTKQIEVPAKGDLIVAASDAESTIPENSSGDKISDTILVSSGYSKTSDFTGPAL